MLGEAGAVIEPITARASPERAAIDPEEDWRIVRIRGCPDIQSQAVFAHWDRRRDVDAHEGIRRLKAGRSEFGGLAYSLPAGQQLGRFPTQVPDGRTRIRDALEDP